MKKILWAGLICLLVLLLSACVADGKGDDPAGSEPLDSSVPEVDGILLSGDESYRIVYAEDCLEDAEKLLAHFYSLDEKEREAHYEIVPDTVAEDGTPEILVGDTNRPQSKDAKTELLGYLDFSVRIFKSNKISIYAHDDARMDDAIEYFISKMQYSEDGELLFSQKAEKYVARYNYDCPELSLDGKDISTFSIVVPTRATKEDLVLATSVAEWIRLHHGAILPIVSDVSENENEILIGNTARKESRSASAHEIKEFEYLLDLKSDGTKTKMILVSLGDGAEKKALDVFSETLCEKKTFEAADALRVRYQDATFITTGVEKLRDPCVLLHDGVYYMYGTGWECYKNTSGFLDGEWEPLGVVVTVPDDAEKDFWAPEVYAYGDAFYMFTTYFSRSLQKRGCAVFRADSPEGPFVEISDGHVTSPDRHAIDGTLYVDDEGQPWMVFVDEWVSTPDGIGRMAVAKLSDDLTHFISEPIELFSAADGGHSENPVTDGCWLYRCENGELLMLWSTWDAHGYCVAIARSDNGKIDGNWTHDEKTLFSRSMTGGYDGGHGMIFVTPRGQMYLSIHSPNAESGNRKEVPTFIWIKEENGTLVWAKP